MVCGEEDFSCLLIAEVSKSCVACPERRQGLVFGLGISVRRMGQLGTTGKDMPWDTGQPGHSNE